MNAYDYDQARALIFSCIKKVEHKLKAKTGMAIVLQEFMKR